MTAKVLAAALAAGLALGGCGGSESEARDSRPVTLFAVGDAANGSDDATAVARMVKAARPDRMLYLGDVYPAGTADDFRSGYEPLYGGLARRTWPTPGNHEWPNRRDGYLPYWRGKRGSIPRWYAATTGGWEILSLNSEADHGAGSAQLRWLRRRLSQRRTTCRIAFWHRPRFSAGEHGDQPDMDGVWNALRGHAVLVIGGHDHDMQRFKPRQGIVELVSGSGGAPHYRVDHEDDRLAFADDRAFGALRIVLHRKRATTAFIAADGTTLDRSSVSCAP